MFSAINNSSFRILAYQAPQKLEVVIGVRFTGDAQTGRESIKP